MYDKRVKVLVFSGVVLLAVCLFRLASMQLFSDSFYRERIDELKLRQRQSRQLRTIRGRVLAVDEPRFHLGISTELSGVLDERVRKAKLLKAAKRSADDAVSQVRKQLADARAELELIIDKCVQFGMGREEVLQRLANINDRIWDLRTFIAWVRNGPSSGILDRHNQNINSIPLSEAIADFEGKFGEDRRLLLIGAVDDIADMAKSRPLLELKTDDDVFAAQLEFLNVDGVDIVVTGHRVYPHSSAAAQTIGWVGPPQQRDKELFAGDRLLRYLSDEVCGREDGVEHVCEAVLRGKRGEVVYDIDRQLVDKIDRRFGSDVRLTLDIELQRRIEAYLADCGFNPNCEAPMAAVVIDVAGGDILALVSLPSFDLNLVRRDYGVLVSDPCEPLRNRAINKQYPPGSVVKPLILIAGLESGGITTGEVIGCPAEEAPSGWPSCWLYRRYNWLGHDGLWPNNAHNAIKGSCNIYFSRLADRLDPLVLQNWLYRFGYGHVLALAPLAAARDEPARDFRQAQGQISNVRPKETITSFEQLPELSPSERRWFGIGQGNFRVTPLQVANAMAAIARGGFYMSPRLVFAASNKVQTIFAEPRTITEPKDTSSQLAPVIDMVMNRTSTANRNQRI